MSKNGLPIKSGERGVALVVSLVIALSLAIMGVTLLELVWQESLSADVGKKSIVAQQLADAAGEIVIFDRSWYNRAGVERVMGFCSDDDYEEFFRSVPEFEKMLVRSGIRVIKYWFSISDEEQAARFLSRINDPLKQWKLSPMDLESRRRWEAYTRAKEVMLERTHIPEAPWWVVQAVDKKRARLNCIHHLLSQLPYHEIPHESVTLPERQRQPDYFRQPVPGSMIVPEVY